MRYHNAKMYELTTDAHFDSAHFLTNYQGKCENLHGHRWNVTVAIGSENLEREGEQCGMVMDFCDFKRVVREVVDEFDHTFLIEVGSLADETMEALKNEGFALKILSYRTTAENLAKHIYKLIKDKGLNCSWVEVCETPLNRAKYMGK